MEEIEMNQNNNTNSKPALIFPCSGASDVGELADRTARRLARSGSGKMFCLAAIGGRVPQFIDDTQSAEEVIIIDGCSNDCAKKTLNTINVHGHEINLETLGFEKGNSPASGKNINKAITFVKQKLG
jgi:uncharacterized metal-binding protein